MNNLGLKFFQNFRNLKSDAVPRPPRPNNTNNGETNGDDSQSEPEEIIVESSYEEPEEVKKPKSKKPFFIPSKKKGKNGFPKKDKNEEPSSPINTQASGNVINIVNSSNIHWGTEITYNIGGPANSQDKQSDSAEEPIQMTSSIELLMEAQIKPEHVHIDYISKNLGKNWHSFFRTLGYTKGRIETMELDEERNGVSEARYKLLLDWVRNDDNGTLGRLATLLWQEGERQVVKELAILDSNQRNA